MNDFEIFSGSSNIKLAKKIASKGGVSLGNVTIKKFEDSETFIKFEENIRGKDIFLIQSTCNPVNDSLMELCLMIDAAKRSSAKSIIPVIPYFGYARQDRKDSSRVPISSKMVVNMLQVAGADRVISVDLHSPQIQGFFDIPMDHLYCTKVISKHIYTNYDKNTTTLVAPDSGSMKTVQRYSEILGMRFSTVYKNRLDDTTTEAMFVMGEDNIKGKNCILIDDLTSTCGTLNSAAKMLKDKGALSTSAVVSHCCLNDKGYKNLNSGELDKLITTDTVPVRRNKKITVLSIADLLLAAITRTQDGRSIADLFRVKPGEFEEYEYDDDEQ